MSLMQSAGVPCEKCGRPVLHAAKTKSTTVVLEPADGAGGNYAVDRGRDGVLRSGGLTVHQARMRVRAGLQVFVEHKTHCVGRR
ncbi:hypothetical protein [Rhodococcoides fascians]|uniref:hypothetical protein n=1 Tax=Rhodococcoides fascians TaxID=1828 RepID=UPI000562AE11|nr:hypothetical protein [Rhodococcus fascians]